MKKFLVLCTCLVVMLVAGCSNDSYERSSETGKVIQITYKEYQEKEKTKESYMVLVTQTYCSYCNEYKDKILDPYLTKHGLTIYELNITNETDPTVVYDEIQKEYSDFAGTPTTLIFEGGKNKVVHSGVLEEDELEDYVTSYQLDKK